jgi:8-oxo-dGTP diphosphatase
MLKLGRIYMVLAFYATSFISAGNCRTDYAQRSPEEGCTARATSVDHIVSLGNGGDPFNRPNLRGLCFEHHRQRSSRQSARGAQEATWASELIVARPGPSSSAPRPAPQVPSSWCRIKKQLEGLPQPKRVAHTCGRALWALRSRYRFGGRRWGTKALGYLKGVAVPADASGDERHSVAVAAIVFDERDRVLLMRRRDHGNWEPPGGVLKPGEQPDEGVAREVREETGVEVEVGPLTGVYTNVELGVVTLAFRAEPRSDPTEQSDEASGVRWIATRDIDRILPDEYATWIRDGLGPGLDAVRSQRRTVKGASESPRC